MLAPALDSRLVCVATKHKISMEKQLNKSDSCDQTMSGTLGHNLPIVIGTISLLSLITCIAAVVLLLWQRMYRTFTHRSILYLLLYTIFASASSALTVAGAFDTFVISEAYSPFCSFSGFIGLYGISAQLIGQTVLTVHLGCVILLVEIRCTRPLGHHYLGITSAFETDSSSHKAKCYSQCLELIYALSPLVLPLLYVWVPFIHNNYGPVGVWCWIRRVGDDCEQVLSGVIEQYALWYGPQFFLTLVNTCIIIATIVTIIWKAHHFRKCGETPTDYRNTLKQVLPILAYPIIFQLLSLFALSHRLSNLISPTMIIPLLIMHSIASPSWGIFAAATFMVYFVVWKRHKKEEKERQRAISNLPLLLDEDRFADNKWSSPYTESSMTLYSTCKSK